MDPWECLDVKRLPDGPTVSRALKYRLQFLRLHEYTVGAATWRDIWTLGDVPQRIGTRYNEVIALRQDRPCLHVRLLF